MTGSERAGAAVAEIAGRNLKKVVLELGGSDPFILLSTDDLDGVVGVRRRGAARQRRPGRATRPSASWSPTDLYEPFVDKLTAALTAVEPGDPSSPDTRWARFPRRRRPTGSRTSCKRAVAGGAKLSGGDAQRQLRHAGRPDRRHAAERRVHREELFGPVAIVYRVAIEDEAVEVANDTPYGLGSYVFTTDTDQALRVADRIEAGMVFVNVVGADAAELPFGGVKRSGFGRELGRFGAEEFVNRKLVRIG